MLNARGGLLLTSEAGLAGHPDKVADRIGDAVLDAHLEQDPHARVGCNALVAHDLVVVAGQVHSSASVDVEQVTRQAIAALGYRALQFGLDADSCRVILAIDEQDPALARAVEAGGAGDSAIVFGAACIDTAELMPLGPALVHEIAATIDRARITEAIEGISPDGKIQATVRYRADGSLSVDNLVLSVGIMPGADRRQVEQQLAQAALGLWPAFGLDDREQTTIHFRRGVGFDVGGPRADCGLSGRKVVSDTYGGWAHHGGGGLSGKDPTKIDRCGTYLARHIAKNVVASGIAQRCELQIAYLIGSSSPVGFAVDLGDGHGAEAAILDRIRALFSLEPALAIDGLDLRRPIYSTLSTYGHFGRPAADMPWENTGLAGQLAAAPVIRPARTSGISS